MRHKRLIAYEISNQCYRLQRNKGIFTQCLDSNQNWSYFFGFFSPWIFKSKDEVETYVRTNIIYV